MLTIVINFILKNDMVKNAQKLINHHRTMILEPIAEVFEMLGLDSGALYPVFLIVDHSIS